jgi:DNA repair exonuclease SbcCD ATPase subunit
MNCSKKDVCKLKHSSKTCEFVKEERILKITLKQLIIKNFKGLKEFELNVNGKNADIYGNNGKGKTTLKDALNWLLFDKDSQNKKDFSIKPQDETGNPIHFLDTEVEAILDCDGKDVKLKKVFREKWVKKRGQEQQEFSGHETDYWCDDVPLKKGEYTAKIDNLVKEELFKLLTDPMYFNTQLKWEKKREVLFELAGANISDEDVIFSNPGLKDLSGILGGKSIEDYKKILSARLKSLKEQLEKIPIRIDETVKGMPQEIDLSVIEKELQEQNIALQAVESKLMNFEEAAKEYISKQQQLSNLQGKLQQRSLNLQNEANKAANDAILKKNELQSAISTLQSDIKSLVSENERYSSNIEELNKKIVALREQWTEENVKKFVEPSGLTCQTCGQDLPADIVGEKTEKLRAKFEKDKDIKLTGINTEGKANAERINNLNNLIEENQLKMVEKQESIDKYTTDLNAIPVVAAVDVDLSSDGEYSSLVGQIKALQDDLQKPVEDNRAELKQSKATIESKITLLNRQLGSKDTIEKSKARIEELKQEQKETSQQKADLEKHDFLIEQFTKSKCNLLEESINKHFEFVRFKLFDKQINGGISECCETLVNTNGSYVEFGSANNAGRFNAGLDIIRALNEFYNVSVPIFVDNAESVVELIPVNTQVIRLVVSDTDNELRIEGREI